MRRWMLTLGCMGIGAMLGCGDDDDTDARHPDDGRTEARDDAGSEDGPSELPPDGEDVTDGEAEADVPVDPCGATSCPNDPVDGPIGTPCLDNPDCMAGLTCFEESVDPFSGEEYIDNPGGYCVVSGYGSAGCDPDVPSSCPNGSKCLYFGENPTTGEAAYGCLDRCSAASSSGVPWTNNCDCRDGYECEISLEVCISGCNPENERECCEIWHDGEGGAGDGARQRGEVTLLGPDRCTNTCDPCTYRCVNNGCPGGDCHIGDPCEHDADCPADSYCISEFRACDNPEEFCYFPGGACFKARCDLEGRECPTGSGCTNLGSEDDPYIICVKPCEVGTQPGDEGFACRNTGDPGPDPGDYACLPLFDPDADWLDGTTATGFCYYAGNFPGGTTLLGGECTQNSDCNSPFGLGACVDFLDTPPKFCTVYCNQPAAEAGACETDDVVGTASGVCWSGVCFEACDHPNAPLGAANTGCTLDSMGCWPANPFIEAGAAYVHTGETAPQGFCFPGCTSDAWCDELFGRSGINCDEATGVCDIFGP